LDHILVTCHRHSDVRGVATESAVVRKMSKWMGSEQSMVKLFVVQFPASFQSCTKQCFFGNREALDRKVLVFCFFVLLMSEPWLLRLVAGRSHRRSGFDSHPPCVRVRDCGGQRGTGTGFSVRSFVFPCHYHATNASYSVVS